MNEWLSTIRDQLSDHGIKVAVAVGFTILGWLFGRWKAARDWRRREFFNRLNISLNSIIDGKLLIRTVLEKSCEEVFMNRVAVDRLLQAAQQTTPAEPLIPLIPDDRWFYLNSILNEISEKFSSGLFLREAARPHDAVRYLICLTNECDGDVRTRKIRAMVVRRDRLLSLPSEQPVLESPNHAVRWKTLQHMQKRYATDPSMFLDVEILI
jgi:hypothetical protein